MNTLHWHAVDAESFPIESTTYPRLSEYGAYAPSAGMPLEEGGEGERGRGGGREKVGRQKEIKRRCY